MNAPCLIEDPQRKALEKIAAITRAALHNPHHANRLRSLFDPALFALAGYPAVDDKPDARATVTRAKALYAARRRRDRAFAGHADLLSDPAWDILLDLFIALHENHAVSVSSVCLAACVAQTTALRWLSTLERRNLIERTPDRDDRRRHFVSLSAEGLALVEHALVQI